MPIIRVTNSVEDYRIRARESDIHQMAGRNNKHALTEFVNARIMESLVLESTDVLVDIGCGDGSLLRKVSGGMRIGTAGSADEVERLQREIPGVDFRAGAAQSLPIRTAIATKVACNAVLFYLPSEHEVSVALGEIARIAKVGAIIWIGEIPAVDEYAKYKMYRGNSIPGLLWYLLRIHGLRTFLGMCRKLVNSAFGYDQLVLNSSGMYYASPDHFVELAQGRGLHLESYFKHRELDAQGQVVESATRFDYVFRK